MAEEAARRVDNTLATLKLESKERHHSDFLLTSERPAAQSRFQSMDRFRHLGLEFRADGSVGLSRDKARRVAIEIIRDVVQQGLRSVAIIDYYLKHVDDEEQLRQLDRWLAEQVLSLAFRNGHRRGNFRRLPFARMRAWGLPSLRHRHRLLRHGALHSSFFRLRTEKRIEQERRRPPSGRRRQRGAGFPPGPEAAPPGPPRAR